MNWYGMLAKKAYSTRAEHAGGDSWWKGKTMNEMVVSTGRCIGSICGSAMWSWFHDKVV